MIVEITVHNNRLGREVRARIVATEVVGYEESEDHAGAPAVEIITRGARVVALYDTLETFTERLTAARGGIPLHVHAMDPRKRPERKARPELAPPPAPVDEYKPPHGQIIVPGASAPAPLQPPSDAAGQIPQASSTSETDQAATAPAQKPPTDRRSASRHK